MYRYIAEITEENDDKNGNDDETAYPTNHMIFGEPRHQVSNLGFSVVHRYIAELL